MEKKWEVSLYADTPNYQIFCKDFRTLRGAKHYIKNILSRDDDFYCATIWREDKGQFLSFYWNGERVIPWDKSWVLSSRQAKSLDVDKRGKVIFKPSF
jgi:hypothetical protein